MYNFNLLKLILACRNIKFYSFFQSVYFSFLFLFLFHWVDTLEHIGHGHGNRQPSFVRSVRSKAFNLLLLSVMLSIIVIESYRRLLPTTRFLMFFFSIENRCWILLNIFDVSINKLIQFFYILLWCHG